MLTSLDNLVVSFLPCLNIAANRQYLPKTSTRYGISQRKAFNNRNVSRKQFPIDIPDKGLQYRSSRHRGLYFDISHFKDFFHMNFENVEYLGQLYTLYMVISVGYY